MTPRSKPRAREREALDVAVAALLAAEALADALARPAGGMMTRELVLALRGAFKAARVQVDDVRGVRRSVREGMRLEGIMRELLVKALPGPGPRPVARPGARKR